MRRYLNPQRSEPRETRMAFFDEHLQTNLNRIFRRAPGASRSRSLRSGQGRSLNGSSAQSRPHQQHRVPAQSGLNPTNSQDVQFNANPTEAFLSGRNYPLLAQQIQNVQQQQWESSLLSIPSGTYQPHAPAETHIQPVASLVSPLPAHLFPAPDSLGQYPVLENPMDSLNAHVHLEESGGSTLPEVSEYANYLPGSDLPPSLPVSMPLPPTSETSLFQIRGPQGSSTVWNPVSTSIHVHLKHSYITQSLAVMLGAELIPFHPGHSSQEIPCTDYVEGVSFAYDFYERIVIPDLTIRVWPDNTQPAMLYIGRALMARLFDELRPTTLDSPGN